ncbi:DNA-directed RNA polymerase subunit K [Candidatus Woesearchaeota archaeon]|nr:DNA-directed RNA polymerase subunit K [Candidatus Woesearchaeota archaeon]
MKEEFTKYERARIIGARALQIAMGAPILLKMKKEDFERMKYNPINIARKEFEEGILPLSVKRPFPEKSKK